MKNTNAMPNKGWESTVSVISSSFETAKGSRIEIPDGDVKINLPLSDGRMYVLARRDGCWWFRWIHVGLSPFRWHKADQKTLEKFWL